MKKKLGLLLACFVLVATSLSFPGLAHGTNTTALPELGTILGGGDGFPPIFTIGADCKLHTSFSVYVANLDILTRENETRSAIYHLPAGYPPMELLVEISGVSFSFLIEDFVFDSLHLGLYNVYKSTVDVAVDIESECIENEELDWTWPLAWSLDLVDANYPASGIPEPYPLCDYTGEFDLFTCNVFYYYEYPDCPMSNGCDSETLTSIDASFLVYCEDCPNYSEGYNESVESHNSQIRRTFKATPNPFQDQFTLTWKENASPQLITVYDINGEALSHWEGRDDPYATRLELDAANWPSGIYLARIIHADGQSESIKLVKE